MADPRVGGKLREFRLLALDLDGTLVPHGSALEERVIACVARLKARGIAPVIATGRRYATTLPVIQALALDTPCVVQNGAVVVAPDGTRIQTQYLDGDVHRAAIHSLKQLGLAPIAYLDGTTGLGEFYIEAGAVDPTGFLKQYTRSSRGQFSVVQDLASVRLKGVTRVITVDHLPRLESARAFVTERFGDRLRAFITHDPHYDVRRLELMNPNASKRSGVEFVAAQLGIALNDVVAIGDDVNDLEMISAAGLGIAVQNALGEVKAVAAMVTRGKAADGFIEAMDLLLAT
jgi:Cof subfamily protein (haloacid dehalogenase superfamily)